MRNGLGVVAFGLRELSEERFDLATLWGEVVRPFQIMGGGSLVILTQMEQPAVGPRGRLARCQLDCLVEACFSKVKALRIDGSDPDLENPNIFRILRRARRGQADAEPDHV